VERRGRREKRRRGRESRRKKEGGGGGATVEIQAFTFESFRGNGRPVGKEKRRGRRL